MSSFLEESHFAVVDFLLVLSFFIKCELNFIPNNYMHSWTNKYMRQMIKQWVTYTEVKLQCWPPVLENTTCQDMRHGTGTYQSVIVFKIKLKKGCTCLHLCNFAEVVNLSSKWHFKIQKYSQCSSACKIT